MLKVPAIEFLLRGIPEAYVIMLAAYIFANKKIDIKKLSLASMLFAIMVYIIRNSPINYGVHTIVCLFTFILIVALIINIDFIKAIKLGGIIFITQFLCDGLNIIIITKLLNKNLGVVFDTPMGKIIYGCPSLLIFTMLLSIYYIMFYRKKVRN